MGSGVNGPCSACESASATMAPSAYAIDAESPRLSLYTPDAPAAIHAQEVPCMASSRVGASWHSHGVLAGDRDDCQFSPPCAVN